MCPQDWAEVALWGILPIYGHPLLKASLRTVLLYSLCVCFRDITESPSGRLEPGKIIYWKQFIWQILTFASNCFQRFIIWPTPQTAQIQQITFLTLCSQLLNSCLRIICIIWQAALSGKHFVPTFGVVGQQKQCWALWVYGYICVLQAPSTAESQHW